MHVGSLLQQAALSTRMCTRGCLVAHNDLEGGCPRTLPGGAGVAGVGTVCETAVVLEDGVWDSLKVVALPTVHGRVWYYRVDVEDRSNPAISFPVGFAVNERTHLESMVPWSHRISFNPPGIAPVRPILRLRCVGEAPAERGRNLPAVPREPYLGIVPSAWKAVDASRCASERFHTLVGGLRSKVDDPEGTRLTSSRAFATRTTIGHGPMAPSASIEDNGERVTCGWCGKVYEGRWAQLRYHQTCAPDTVLLDGSAVVEAPRKKAKMNTRDV